jgi:hypothetical protein
MSAPPAPFVMETPNLGRPWCPACEPERDPTREILHVDLCGHHRPGVAPDDARAAAKLAARSAP